MILRSLHIRRQDYGDKSITGSVEFANGEGKIELVLDEQLCTEIVAVCADALVRVSKTAAENMTASMLEGFLLEPPKASVNARSGDHERD